MHDLTDVMISLYPLSLDWNFLLVCSPNWISKTLLSGISSLKVLTIVMYTYTSVFFSENKSWIYHVLSSLWRGLTESTVDGFVDDVLVNGKPWASSIQEALTGSHVFVCAHGSRDKRCGVCGPALIEKLIEEIEIRGLTNQITVSPCSHIGGHKYAGNVIIYSPDSDGKITGHWWDKFPWYMEACFRFPLFVYRFDHIHFRYGYVTPDDVPELIDQHIDQGQVIERLWR